jgi:hypothetical protein
VIVIHVALLVAVQLPQPAAVTVMVSVPPVEVKFLLE